jgi:carboxyl-terminal processing protease
MKFLKLISIFLISFLSCSSSPQKVTNDKPPISLNCNYADKIFKIGLSKHIDFNKITPDLEKRVIESFIYRIDPTKAYVLNKEVEALKNLAKKNSLFNDLKGKCDKIIPSFYNLYLSSTKRYTEKVLKFAKSIKKEEIDSFKTSDDDRKYDNYPKNINELDERVKISTLKLFKYLKATDDSFKNVHKNFIKEFKNALEKINEKIKEAKGTPDDQHDKYRFSLEAFIQALDAHSTYVPFSRFLQNDEEFNKGFFFGVGILISKEPYKGIKVKEIYKNGPAGKNGALKPGDIIHKVNGTSVIDIPLEEGVKLIKGPQGTKVKLDFIRHKGDEAKNMSVTLIRNKVSFTESIKVELIKRKNKKIAFIKLDTFFRNAASGVYKKYLSVVGSTKIDGLILDLSQNGGGLLTEAIELADHFIDRGPVVATKYANNSIKPLVATTPGELASNVPMIVLVNMVSASASEIVAGALKDFNRAIIVGQEHTFGKGSVQDVIPISNGKLGGINITIAKFFRPSGKSTQLKGIPSDIVIPGTLPNDFHGEKDQLFPVSYEEIPPLLSEKTLFKYDYKKHLPLLIKKSKKRVDKSPIFSKLKKDKTELNYEEIEEEKPFKEEAINILLDYLELTKKAS